MDNFGDDWEAIFKVFEEERVYNTNAIADLAIDNFYEMRDHVDDVAFKRKRKIEMALEQKFPDYYSKYSLVTFNPELTYLEAKTRGRKQDELLLTLCKEDNYEDIPLETYHHKLMNLTA